jgi:hypothetical protein
MFQLPARRLHKTGKLSLKLDEKTGGTSYLDFFMFQLLVRRLHKTETLAQTDEKTGGTSQ